MHRTRARRWLDRAGGLYLGALYAWLALHALAGDRWWWTYFPTAFAPHLFLPLVAVLTQAVLRRRRWLLLASTPALVIWLALWGPLFAPPPRIEPTRPLTVMTYNVDASNCDVSLTIDAILASDADLIGLQELPRCTAGALEQALADRYPHRLLVPDHRFGGMGLLSRHPFHAVETAIGPNWVGRPQSVEVDVDGVRLLWLNLHAAATKPKPSHALTWRFAHTTREREASLRTLADVAAASALPVVVTGDLNSVPLADAMRPLREAGLVDAWAAAGWGYGFTYRARLGANAVPALVRIDYVLASGELTIARAVRPPWDGASDHHAVIADIVH